MRHAPYIAPAVGMAAILAALLTLSLLSCYGKPAYPPAPINGDSIAISLDTIAEDSPAFYSHSANKRTVSFFVFRHKGRTMAFLDACHSCYSKKLGYEFAGGRMHCRACDERYSLDELETGSGNCFPVRLESSIRDGLVLIPLSAISNAYSMF